MNDRSMSPFADVSAPRGQPRLIAHRGAKREAPENTLPAIERALEMGCGGIEFDVQLTADKVPVLTHNDDLSILTHFNGYLHQASFETARSIDVGSHFSTKFAGTTMPTLAEALEVISPHDVLTVIDIKAQPGMHRAVARLVGGIASDIRMHGRVVLATRSVRIIHELKKHHPLVPRALTIRIPPFPFFPTALFAKFEGISSLHPSLRALWPSIVARMKRTGLEINAWTANEPADFDLCADFELDGIFTDDLAAAKAHFGNAAGR